MCCSSGVAVGTVLSGEALAGSGLVGISDPESWLAWSERYGFPMVTLTFLMFLSVWAVRSLWGFVKPLASSLVESFMSLIQKQSDFIDTVSVHQEEIKHLVIASEGGHTQTRDILKDISRRQDETAGMVREINSRIGR
jgi:uncharacterized protein (DUF3820 family)